MQKEAKNIDKNLKNEKNKAIIYIASPFFDEDKKEINIIEQIEKALDYNDTVFSYFTPMRHNDLENGVEPGSDEWAKLIFKKDLENIDKADTIIVNADFFATKQEKNDPDSGTAMEVGYAYANGKNIIVYQGTDNIKSPLNLMISQAANCYIQNIEELSKIDFKNIEFKKYNGKHI